MRISRLYCAEALSELTTVELTGQSAHYLFSVLRLQKNNEVILFNGDGNDYSGIICNATKKSIHIKITHKKTINNESALKIHLGQAISRSEKMDWVIQKAVELGVTEITPLMTQHCAVKSSSAQLDKKLSHWQGIIISSCEQSGRNVIPKLHSPTALADWISQHHDCGILFDPLAKASFKSFTSRPSHVSLLIGPEGGLSQNEITLAEQQEFKTTKLGPRILRTETAAIAAITAVQLQWGDF